MVVGSRSISIPPVGKSPVPVLVSILAQVVPLEFALFIPASSSRMDG